MKTVEIVGFPSFYKSIKNGNFIVEFNDYMEGEVVYNDKHHPNSLSKHYEVGYYSFIWKPCTDREEWVPLTLLEAKALKAILKKEI